ncbi:hypothetical protein WJX73_004433 [Symbiochloris irregularis]|uniref:Nascent polypeptide-associated complex subunit alpha-like UBA domain-containing protein n=1 Tax=Symbiochloris irregularis TaxID=706552 RepID=A0AAW1NX44_9CHLO
MSDEKQTLVKDDSVEAEDAVKTREAAEQAQALDKLTDKVEDKELDQGRVQKAMAELAESQQQQREAQRLRQKELAAVKLQKEDIELVAYECEIDKKAAEAQLRQHRGDVKATLIAFL